MISYIATSLIKIKIVTGIIIKLFLIDNDIIISVDITKMNISEKKEADGVEIIAGNVLDEKKRIYVFDQEMKLKEKYNISNTSETITALTLAGKKDFSLLIMVIFIIIL